MTLTLTINSYIKMMKTSQMYAPIYIYKMFSTVGAI